MNKIQKMKMVGFDASTPTFKSKQTSGTSKKGSVSFQKGTKYADTK